jgi:hypothetical protein
MVVATTRDAAALSAICTTPRPLASQLGRGTQHTHWDAPATAFQEHMQDAGGAEHS